LSKKLHIRTYGCQMNVYDSARLAELLAPLDYAPSEAADGADLIVLNTCHIREKAAEKVYSELGRLRVEQAERAASGGAPLQVVVAGCVAQAEGAEILRRAPHVAAVVGPQSLHRLPDLLARGGAPEVAADFPAEEKFAALAGTVPAAASSAFLTVQEGCDKFCTFCVVPYTRGGEYSRPAADILAEADKLLAAGARELVLLGQNVNAWHGTGADGRAWTLGRLLHALADRAPDVRLRYTTSHPLEMDDALIAAHGDLPQLMPFLHLPVQSGSDRILRAMNRRHRADDYLRVVERLRAARPDLALSTDFIVGFPGETEADFAATLELIRAVGFAQAFSFKYSPRAGTPAATMAGQVDDAVATARLAELQALLQEQQLAFNRSFAGRRMSVLVEKPGRRAGQWIGKSPWLQSVVVEGPETLRGQVIETVINAAYQNSLMGEPVHRPAPLAA
jgi:tRNA-2-methylthio-N6-dimethylallyladenosine synthase